MWHNSYKRFWKKMPLQTKKYFFLYNALLDLKVCDNTKMQCIVIFLSLPKITKTRWTSFRFKLVFKCNFEISWSLGPLDLGTLGPLPSSNTSSYFPLHPCTSPYLFVPLSSFDGLVMGGG